MKSLEDELRSYLSLPHGWDGYGGVPAHQSSVEDALLWLATLPAKDALPLPMVAGDGEVSLYWSCPNAVYLEVSFPGDSTCHFIACLEHERYGSDDLDISIAAKHLEFFKWYECAVAHKRSTNETHS